jgi:hypothetical protein
MINASIDGMYVLNELDEHIFILDTEYEISTMKMSEKVSNFIQGFLPGDFNQIVDVASIQMCREMNEAIDDLRNGMND